MVQYRFTNDARDRTWQEEISSVLLRLACLHHFKSIVAARGMYGLSGSVITLENQPSRHDCLEGLFWIGEVQILMI